MGAVTRLRASPRMYPWKVRGPPRRPSLTAAPQGRWARDAASALPPPPPLPFREPAGLGGGGEGVSAGLGESEPPVAPSALSRVLPLHPGIPRRRCGRPQPANFRPACAIWVLGSPGRIPLGSASRCFTARGCRPAPRCGPAARPGVLETAARLGLARGLTDVKEKASRSRLPDVDSQESSCLLRGISGRIEINADLVGLESVTPRGRGNRLRNRGQARGKERLHWTWASVVKFVRAGGVSGCPPSPHLSHPLFPPLPRPLPSHLVLFWHFCACCLLSLLT